MVRAAGIPVTDIPFVTIGGGIGSFVTVDYLRIAGVAADRIAVLSNLDFAWQTYEYLTRVSQIPRPERIRSDSASRPDNIWGFPSYALAEAIGERTLRAAVAGAGRADLGRLLHPEGGAGIRRARAREQADRLVPDAGQGPGQDGQEAPGRRLLRDPDPDGRRRRATKRLAYRAEFVHLAVGYPGLRFLPELQEFRTAHQDFHHVVSAYEEHEHVYEAARTKHLVVMLRGGGIVASRVLQRLMDDRAKYGLSTEIVHLFRTYIDGSHGPNAWSRRKGAHGFAYQGFNYPKSVWGGQLKARMRKLEGEDRGKAYKLMGGTNTPYRRRWQAQMNEGRDAGWYRTMAGTVEQMRLDQGKIISVVKTQNGMVEVAADFVIDCTGLEADIAEHRVLADLLEHSGAGRNPLGRLDVERTFELRGSASGPGVMYASGATTLGGYFPGVDTFLGLQVAAQEIADDLARRGFCHRIGTVPLDHAVAPVGPRPAALTATAALTSEQERQTRCYPPWVVGSRPGCSCSPWSAGS